MSMRVLVTCALRAASREVARRLLSGGAAVALDAGEAIEPAGLEAAPASAGLCWVAPAGLAGSALTAFARDRLGGLDAVVHGDEGLDEGALFDAGELAGRVGDAFARVHELTRAAVGEMVRRRSGRIVFLLCAGPGGTGPVLRAGKLALMRSLAAELRPLGITSAAVTLCAPMPRQGRRAAVVPPVAEQAELLDIVLSPTLAPLLSGQHLGGGPADPEVRSEGAAAASVSPG